MITTCLTAWPSASTEREQLCRQWNELVDAAEWASVFQRFEWVDAWWGSFGTGVRLQLLLVHDNDGQLLAIAPLMLVDDRNWGVRRTRLMLLGTSNHASDYADFIVRRGHAAARRAILDWIAAQRECWTELELLNLPAASPSLAELTGPEALPSTLLQYAAEAPARVLEDRAADLRAANKKSLRRHVNGFAREGELVWKRLSDIDERAGHFDAFFDQHVARWASTPTPSLFTDPAQRAFYLRLAAGLAPAGLLHFSVVLFRQQPIAYHFGFERDGVFTWYKPSYDPAMERRSPGEVLIKFLLDDAIARELREFDFTIGAEPFKFRFANQLRRVYRVRAYQRMWERVPALGRDALKRLAGIEKAPRSGMPAMSGN
jgi:CelD/BcsL family acetyltransferase involved in cellulose biosynthesis